MKYLVAIILFLNGCVSIQSSSEIQPKKPIKTWTELRDQNVVKQKLDYSCGAASIATLIKYYFQDDITEKEILDDIKLHLTPKERETRKETGYSLLDLKKFAVRRGYSAIGVKLKPTYLSKLKGPILVRLVDSQDYKHFTILRGIKNNQVFLADPSFGNIHISMDNFFKEWSRIALILGKKGFKPPKEYPLKIRADELLRPERLLLRQVLR
ncbi:C39 family peptidase [Candidatus Halobeggiatoa sp. HSG11]|nr:C39 family peptidase [Candidatus Halobeggiatoa sp. HSG11]